MVENSILHAKVSHIRELPHVNLKHQITIEIHDIVALECWYRMKLHDSFLLAYSKNDMRQLSTYKGTFPSVNLTFKKDRVNSIG